MNKTVQNESVRFSVDDSHREENVIWGRRIFRNNASTSIFILNFNGRVARTYKPIMP
jgi:hypothetical protein